MRLPWPRQANQVFAVLPRAAHEALTKASARYHVWTPRALQTGERPAADEIFVRLVASFATSAESVDRFVAIAGGA